MHQVTELSTSLEETKLALGRERDVATLYQRWNQDMELALKKKQDDIDSHAFVLVLIDGDCMNFLDDLLRKGVQGGEETARKLLELVRVDVPDLRSNAAIIVRVYANMKGLAKTCVDAKILGDIEDLALFARGFNLGHPFCDYIDAGHEKECTDTKIKGLQAARPTRFCYEIG